MSIIHVLQICLMLSLREPSSNLGVGSGCVEQVFSTRIRFSDPRIVNCNMSVEGQWRMMEGRSL